MLDEDELHWQVREFADKGFGGYFMHARVGLATSYLSEEWMDCVKACLEEGEKVGLESWLYDEDKWPSGFAGGIVPAKSDEYRSRSLIMREIKSEEIPVVFKDPNILGVFEVHFSSPKVIEIFKLVKEPDHIKGDGQIFLFQVQVAGHSSWFNGESYVDLLNPKVTEEFLKVTIDAYAEKFRNGFGEYMPGIFTDEPNYALNRLIPWTSEMPEYFRKLNGYDLLEKLPLLYFEGEGCYKVRYDFWRTVTQRFIEAWTIPYSKKCKELGLKMTGHYLCEDNLIIQTQYIGAAMPHYEYMQVPGIDHLGRNIKDPLTLKQCSSVAHQFGKKRILCEIFGCSGHSMTFEDQKWIADFHFALGITFLCPHLTLYTQNGEAKRDYPPTFSYHQTYWPHYKLINDYFARASYLCSQGRFYADILLLNPIGSVWATYTPNISKDRDSPPWKYDESFVTLLDDLLALHWDFDLGDEMIIARHANVEGGLFVVNDGRYKVVVVPPSLTWARKTVDLLTQFLETGGRVIFVGETPSLMEGETAEAEWKELLSHPGATRVDADRESISSALEKVLSRSVRITDEKSVEIGDIYVHHRVVGPQHIYFLSNKSRSNTYNAVITFAEKGEITEWDLFTGSVFRVPAVTQGEHTVINVVFPPAGSHAFVLDTSKSHAPEGSLSDIKTEFKEKTVKLPETWSFKRLHPNSMTLDTCQYSVNDGEWSEKKPLWKVRKEVWEAAGLEAYTGIQPWVLIEKNIKPSRSFTLKLRSTFKSEVEGKRVFLVLEKAPLWKISVNDRSVSTETKEWHWDKQFGKIDISDYVKVGENTIEMSCLYGLDVPIEKIYLIGDFGVKKISDTEYVLSEEPKTLRDGNWVEQGYPFYAGTIRYQNTFSIDKKADQRISVRLPEAKGSLFLVYINGMEPIPVCWHPLEADVTDYVVDGKNKLTIDVVSTLRNTFGPLHHKLGDALTFVGPNTFVDEENWVDAYQFAPYGLILGAEIVIHEK